MSHYDALVASGLTDAQARAVLAARDLQRELDAAGMGRKVTRLYEMELEAIDQLLTAAGVPDHFDDGEAIPTRIRVRWLLDQWLELRAR